jgi:site-specific recombinase XerD
MKLFDAIQEFLLSRRANGSSEETVRWYASLLERFCAHVGRLDITTHDMRSYVVDMRGALAQTSVNGHVTALHVFYTWAADEYGISNPMRGIHRPQPVKAIPRGIAPADMVKLLSVANTRDRALIALFADSGARLGGIAGLETVDVDLEGRSAFVLEKGRKPRRVYFTPFTAAALRNWIQERGKTPGSLFTNMHTGEGLTASGISQILKRLKHKAGIRGRVNPHSFRHGFAREYIRAGGDIVTLARLLGHENITTTAAFYAVFSDDELKEFHGRYSPMRGTK